MLHHVSWQTATYIWKALHSPETQVNIYQLTQNTVPEDLINNVVRTSDFILIIQFHKSFFSSDCMGSCGRVISE